MADKQEREEGNPQGNGWEVVSLTSSAYAAAPGPELVNTNDDSGHTVKKDETVVMSGHFVFPPSQHENLPLEPEKIEVQNVHESVESSSRLATKEEVNWGDEGLGEPDEFNGRTTLQGLDLIEKDRSMTSASNFGYFLSEETRGGSAANNGSTVIPRHMEPSEELLPDMLNAPNNAEEGDEYNSSGRCEAWWKKGAALYVQAKESKSFWFIFVSAAVVGLVVLGRRLHGEKMKRLHHKWLLSFDSEKLNRSFGPISRLNTEVGSHRSSAVHHDCSFIGH